MKLAKNIVFCWTQHTICGDNKIFLKSKHISLRKTEKQLRSQLKTESHESENLKISLESWKQSERMNRRNYWDGLEIMSYRWDRSKVGKGCIFRVAQLVLLVTTDFHFKKRARARGKKNLEKNPILKKTKNSHFRKFQQVFCFNKHSDYTRAIILSLQYRELFMNFLWRII